MNNATFDDFLKLDLRVGTVVEAAEFPEAHNPAYILHVDFGPDIGIKKSSAQVTGLYTPQQLLDRQVLAVVNFPPKQIGPIRSECLVTGFHQEDGEVVLAAPERPVPNGTRLA